MISTTKPTTPQAQSGFERLLENRHLHPSDKARLKQLLQQPAFAKQLAPTIVESPQENNLAQLAPFAGVLIYVPILGSFSTALFVAGFSNSALGCIPARSWWQFVAAIVATACLLILYYYP